MTALETDVLVIGGGATGAGVAFDAALRGLRVVLVDRADLGEGTSGRFHGLLHSGARYVTKDPEAARECAAESAIVARIAAHAVEPCGGLFVRTPFDDPDYAAQFPDACARAGVGCEEVDVADTLAAEPRLSPDISRAFAVADASIDVWELLRALAAGVRERGGEVLTRHAVVALHREGDTVVGAQLRAPDGGERDVRAAITINAAGAWAGQIAALAGIESVRVIPGRGIMIAMNHRLVNTAVNRCASPGDGDLLVPVRTVTVMGTTDQPVTDPDDTSIPPADVDAMFDAGEVLVPGFRRARALRVWAGVRPLWQHDPGADVTSTRDVSRAHALLDHRERDDVGGIVTITGGKLTTYRLMAQEAVDAACAALGRDVRCATATTPLRGAHAGEPLRPGARLRARERTLSDDQLVCECELVTRAQVRDAVARTNDLDDVRRELRLGMGPCQGGFCMVRAAALMYDGSGDADPTSANAALRAFVGERWKGIWPVLHGDQLRQAWLDDWIHHGLLGIGELPEGSARDTTGEPPGAGTGPGTESRP